MLFIKPKRPAPPSADDIAAIDNVVEVEAGPAALARRPLWARVFGVRRVPASTAPRATGWGFFARQRASVPSFADALAAVPPTEGPPDAHGLPPTSSPPSPPGTAKKRRSATAAGQALLSLDVGSGSPTYWSVTRSGLALVDPVAAGRALSFSPADTLIAADDAMGLSAAHDLAVGETGEDVVVVNVSKAHRLVLATTKDRVFGHRLRLAPGVLALATLLSDRPRPAAPCVAGFDLQGDGQHVLILSVWGADGLSLEPCQVVVNAGDVGFTVRQFAASRRMNADDVSTLFFDNAELLSVAARLPVYPNEAVFAGLPVTKALGMASALSVLFAVGAGAYAAAQYRATTAARQQVLLAQQRGVQADAAAATLLEQRIHAFARAQSLDVARSLRRAQQLWVPGTTIVLEAKADVESFDVTMPLVRGAQVGSRPSVARALTPAELGALVGLSAPKGCTRTGLFVNGTLNEVQLTVTCENDSPGFTRYRLD